MYRRSVPGEICIPSREAAVNPSDLFNEVFAGLPLDGCRLERCNLTDRLEFVAPRGEVFELTGEFLVQDESNDSSHLMNPPVESQSMREKNAADYPERYEDDDYALNWYEPVSSFIGPKLFVEINHKPYGEIWYQSQLEELKQEPPRVRIGVVAPVDAHSGPALREYSWQQTDGRDKIDFYLQPHGSIYWDITHALGDLDAIVIRRVPDTSQGPELKLPDYWSVDDNIWVPRDGRPDSKSYAAYFGAGLGRKISDEEMLPFMRERRLKGIPLGDDPLRDLVIVQEDKEGGTPVLDELVRKVQEAPPPPKNWREVMQQQEESDRLRLRQQRVDRLSRTVVAVSGSASLSEAVFSHAAPDWMEHELAALAKYDVF